MRRVILQLSPLSEDQGEVIQGSEHVLELIDDQLVAACSMLHSPYAKALEANIRAWREKLYNLLQMLEDILECQKWMQVADLHITILSFTKGTCPYNLYAYGW